VATNCQRARQGSAAGACEKWLRRAGRDVDYCLTVVATGDEGGMASIAKEGRSARDELLGILPVLSASTRAIGDHLGLTYTLLWLKGMQEALDLWQTERRNPDEEFWHEFFREHFFLLAQLASGPVLLTGDKAYLGGKRIDNTGGKVADFLLSNKVTDAISIVEIKTPSTRLVQRGSYRSGVFAPSTDLTGAIAQVQAYKRSLLTDLHALAPSLSGDAYDPPCFVIAGDVETQLATTDERMSFELFRRGLKEVTVVSYDELIERARTLVRVLGNA
jgi:hypothetical protein